MKTHEIVATILAAAVTSVANIIILKNAVISVKVIKELVCDPCEEKKEEEVKEEA